MTSFTAFARQHGLARLGVLAGAVLGLAALALLAATGGRHAELVAAALALAVAALGASLARALESAVGRLRALVAKLESDARVSAIQVELGVALAEIRAALNAQGAPRLVGDKLYFGDHLINGDNALVDARRPRDGFASLLVGDVRVATTLTDASGARALGSRLAPGPVLALYRNGGSYFGTNEVLGKTYVTVYEPLFVDDRPVAAIAVGLPRDAALAEAPAPRNEIARIFAALASLERSTAEKAKLEQQAFAERIRVADEARRVAARALAAVSGQKLVVEGLTEALQKLAQNDLSHRIDAAFPSEYEALKGAFAQAAETLSDTVGALVTQGNAIFEITAQLAENADSLSQRSELQAANLQESAASLNEIASSSKRSAEGASHARDVVAAADADAARGAQVVNEAVGAMRQLSESATKISQIVGLIDEIAFQTNLLALNAGVEAARAGDAGRGFAVVAMEVRALALRSAEAAKEIRVLIGASRAGVTRGVELVTRTGEALNRIVSQVAQLNAIVADIAGGAADQAYALEEISAAINQMDETTQANTVVAQRSTAAAKSLEDEAQQLNALVSQFRLPEAAPARRRAA